MNNVASELNVVLDHLALVVGDLEQARKVYARMGFNLSPRSSHKGVLEENGPVVLWGAGNHCTMFEQGYFEILGITDKNLHSDHVQILLDKYTGLHLIALGCDNADEAADVLRQRLGDIPQPYQVGRDVPCKDGGTLPGKFNILHLGEGDFEEADLFCIEHLTPDALWQPDTIHQDNGVISLVDVLICSDDRQQTCARLSRILGTDFETKGVISTFQLARGQIKVTDSDGLNTLYPEVVAPVLPWVAAVKFGVKNLEQTGRYLTANGFEIREADSGDIWIDPAQSEGAVVVFTSANG